MISPTGVAELGADLQRFGPKTTKFFRARSQGLPGIGWSQKRLGRGLTIKQARSSLESKKLNKHHGQVTAQEDDVEMLQNYISQGIDFVLANFKFSLVLHKEIHSSMQSIQWYMIMIVCGKYVAIKLKCTINFIEFSRTPRLLYVMSNVQQI